MDNSKATEARAPGVEVAPGLPTYCAQATNDPTSFLGEVDGRSREARRFRDVTVGLVQQLGGQDMISAAELLPGIPSVVVGSNPPPILALLATSAQTTPSWSPSENFRPVACSPTV